MHHPRATLLTVLAAALLATTAGAQSTAKAGGPTLTVAALNTTAAQAGEKGRKTVRPDDVLRYTLTFTNPGPKALANVELRNPIPAGLRLVSGSAHASRADAKLEYSADGGRSWSAAPSETVIENGAQVTRPIPVARYTHVRWTVAGNVPAKSQVTADFSAQVVGASPAASGER